MFLLSRFGLQKGLQLYAVAVGEVGVDALGDCESEAES